MVLVPEPFDPLPLLGETNLGCTCASGVLPLGNIAQSLVPYSGQGLQAASDVAAVCSAELPGEPCAPPRALEQPNEKANGAE